RKKSFYLISVFTYSSCPNCPKDENSIIPTPLLQKELNRQRNGNDKPIYLPLKLYPPDSFMKTPCYHYRPINSPKNPLTRNRNTIPQRIASQKTHHNLIGLPKIFTTFSPHTLMRVSNSQYIGRST